MVNTAIQKAIPPTPAPVAPAAAEGGEDMADLMNLLGLDKKDIVDGAEAKIGAALKAHVDSIQKNAEAKFMRELALANRRNQMAELANRVTGGIPKRLAAFRWMLKNWRTPCFPFPTISASFGPTCARPLSKTG